MSGSTTDLVSIRFSVWGSRREVLQGLSGLISTTARRKCEWISFQKEKEEKDETNHKRLITYIKKKQQKRQRTNKQRLCPLIHKNRCKETHTIISIGLIHTNMHRCTHYLIQIYTNIQIHKKNTYGHTQPRTGAHTDTICTQIYTNAPTDTHTCMYKHTRINMLANIHTQILIYSY